MKPTSAIAICFLGHIILFSECVDAKEHVTPARPSSTGDLRDRCATNSLAICLRILEVAPPAIRNTENARLNGAATSLKDCADLAHQNGLFTAGFRWHALTPEFNLHGAPAIVPIVLLDGRRHFIAAVAVKSGELLIADYPHDLKWVSFRELRTRWKWDGTMLHVSKDPVYLTRLSSLALQQLGFPVLSYLGTLLTFSAIVLFCLQIRQKFFHDGRVGVVTGKPQCRGY